MTRLPVLLLLLLVGSCGRNEERGWLGYAEGDTAFVSAPQAGWISKMTVNRGDWVDQGRLLFRLDDTHETAARDQALANIGEAEAELAQERANLQYTQTEVTRQTGLARAHAGVPATLDQVVASNRQSKSRIAQLENQIKQMQAGLADASYQLSQRSVIARTRGHVQDVFFRPGEYAPAMTPIVSLLPPENVFVRFFVPEKEFAQIHLGQRVAISCDGCPNQVARITFIANREEFTPPVIYSLDNRSKLVFKIEARLPGGLKLNPGQPVSVRPV
jgi:HlyD family secretion protein